jgi:Holliday junction resolvase-like predicted endonuclease
MKNKQISSMTNKQVGKCGENIVARVLKDHGWKIVGRNIRLKAGEIDILAEKDHILSFVEVKTTRITHDRLLKDGAEPKRYQENSALYAYESFSRAKIAKLHRLVAEWCLVNASHEFSNAISIKDEGLRGGIEIIGAAVVLNAETSTSNIVLVKLDS